MHSEPIDSLEYTRHDAFGGGVHIRIVRRFDADEYLYQLTDVPVAGGYGSDRAERTHTLPSRAVAWLLDSLAQARISLRPPHLLGLDGSNPELHIVSGFNELHVKWWTRAESQWIPLQKFIDELTNDTFISCLSLNSTK
jgi:hypothetical protein